MPTLVLSREDKPVGTYCIKKKVISIGRSRDNTIAIANGTISRHHVRLESNSEGMFILSDLGSLNGTYVNGKRIETHTLEEGDRISLGVYEIRFSTKDIAQASASLDSVSSAHMADDEETFLPPPPPPSPSPSLPEQASAAAEPLSSLTLDLTSVDESKSVMLLRLAGTLDHTTHPSLEMCLKELAIKGFPNLVIDMKELDSINNDAWSLLINALKAAQSCRTSIRLVHIQGQVRESYDALSISNLIAASESVDQALATFAEHDLSQRLTQVSVPPVPGTVTPIVRRANRQADDLSSALTTADLSIERKIKAVIKENPLATEAQIQRRLRDEDFGSEKIGWLKLRSLLKDLDLDTKLKRYQYFMHS